MGTAFSSYDLFSATCLHPLGSNHSHLPLVNRAHGIPSQLGSIGGVHPHPLQWFPALGTLSNPAVCPVTSCSGTLCHPFPGEPPAFERALPPRYAVPGDLLRPLFPLAKGCSYLLACSHHVTLAFILSAWGGSQAWTSVPLSLNPLKGPVLPGARSD